LSSQSQTGRVTAITENVSLDRTIHNSARKVRQGRRNLGRVKNDRIIQPQITNRGSFRGRQEASKRAKVVLEIAPILLGIPDILILFLYALEDVTRYTKTEILTYSARDGGF